MQSARDHRVPPPGQARRAVGHGQAHRRADGGRRPDPLRAAAGDRRRPGGHPRRRRADAAHHPRDDGPHELHAGRPAGRAARSARSRSPRSWGSSTCCDPEGAVGGRSRSGARPPLLAGRGVRAPRPAARNHRCVVGEHPDVGGVDELAVGGVGRGRRVRDGQGRRARGAVRPAGDAGAPDRDGPAGHRRGSRRARTA